MIMEPNKMIHLSMWSYFKSIVLQDVFHHFSLNALHYESRELSLTAMWNGSCFSFLQNLLWWAWQLMKPVFLWCVLSSLNLSLAKSQTLPQLSSPAPLTKPNAQHAFSSGGTYHRTHTQTFLLLQLGAIASASELLICHPWPGELLL